jgi:hypothetical protein
MENVVRKRKTRKAVDKPLIKKFSTDCCALCQLSLTNQHTQEEIRSVLSKLKKESTAQNYLFTSKDFGQKAVFVITTPNETTLAMNLQALGFVPSFVFERRQGYPGGLLTMWCYNI